MNNMSARHLETSPGHIDEVRLTWSYDAKSEAWAREPNAGILTALASGASATNPFTNEAYFMSLAAAKTAGFSKGLRLFR